MQYDTIDSFLEELPALAAQAGDKLAEHHGLFLIKTGAKKYLIRLNNSQVTLEEPGQEYPNCIVEAEESLLLDMVNGQDQPHEGAAVWQGARTRRCKVAAASERACAIRDFIFMKLL